MSPLRNVEHKFVDIILSLSDIGCPISVGETICLMQSLIDGTPAQQRMIEFQRKIYQSCGHYDIGNAFFGKITRNYYYAFMRRYSDIIEANKGRRFEIQRNHWTVFRNFLNMFLDIERMLIQSRLAEQLPTPIYMDNKGNVVDGVRKSFGCKVECQFNLPQICLVMDEVGGDLNMMNDGHFGGKKFLTRKGDVAKINSTKKSKRFNVLGVTNLSGAPIMCVVILEGKDRNVSVESGIDPFHPLYESYEAADEDEKSNFTFFENNYWPGKLFPGGRVCEFEGTRIPTMIRYSDKGSITPVILTDILQTIDQLRIFNLYRENGATPFLLVDGHQSRFHTTFLKYITNEDHPWKVSLNVLYGTSLWQARDSYQQNGRFKVALMNLKKHLLIKEFSFFVQNLNSSLLTSFP